MYPEVPARPRRTSSAAGCSCSTTSGARSSARPASSAPRPARSSASTWAAWTRAAATTSTGARPRSTASGARSPRCAGPAAPSRTRPTGRSRPIDLAAVDAILEDYDHDPARMLEILEATQAAYGYLPVAALKRISQRTGRLVRDDLRHRELLRATCASSRPRRPSQAAAVAAPPAGRGDLPRRARRRPRREPARPGAPARA